MFHRPSSRKSHRIITAAETEERRGSRRRDRSASASTLHLPTMRLVGTAAAAVVMWFFLASSVVVVVVMGHNDTFAPCPRGSFRSHNSRACTFCPRGTYGSTSGLTDATCTAPCPLGTYNDVVGARTVDDCRECPPGKFGNVLGLTNAECSGPCPPGRYSLQPGLASPTGCVNCPRLYYMWQCNEKQRAYSGKAVPPRAHAFNKKGS
jgi:hypothetical protein